MPSEIPALENFYLKTVKGRPSAETFNAILCIFSILSDKMDAYFKPYALTSVKFNTLILIKHLGGPEGLSQNQICRHLIVSPSNITRLIDRLVANGYAQRIVSKNDRRVKLIKITKKGSEILDQTFHGYGEMIQQSVYVLERKEVEQLAALLLKWFSKLEQTQK